MGNTCSISTETCGYSCTGYQGQHRWKQLHKIVSEIECETCRDHAVKDMSAFHDLVTVGLGEPAYDKKNLKRYVEQVNCVYSACKARGDCL